MGHVWITSTANTGIYPLSFKISIAGKSDAEEINDLIHSRAAIIGKESTYDNSSVESSLFPADFSPSTVFLLQLPVHSFDLLKEDNFKFPPIKLNYPITYQEPELPMEEDGIWAREEDELKTLGMVMFSRCYDTLKTKPGLRIEDLCLWKSKFDKEEESCPMGLAKLLLSAVTAQAAAMRYYRVELVPCDPNEDGIGMCKKLGIHVNKLETVYRVRITPAICQAYSTSGTLPPHKIRPAVQSDMSVLNDLILEMATITGRKKKCYASEGSIFTTLFYDNQKSFTVYLLEVYRVVAGFILFFPNYSTLSVTSGFCIGDFFVKEVYQNKELLEKRLLSAVMDQAVAMGYERVEMLSSSLRNISMLEEKYGFHGRQMVWRIPIC